MAAAKNAAGLFITRNILCSYGLDARDRVYRFSREPHANSGAGEIADRVTTIEVVGLTGNVIRGDLFFAIKDAEFKRAPEFGRSEVECPAGNQNGNP
ncbi:MAG: hypothetical protein DMG40_19510 [Acidobacteria bacterium]|nr:MAG: hypothetical protein DMG40_19510 [Acidobacteriota bacterium]